MQHAPLAAVCEPFDRDTPRRRSGTGHGDGEPPGAFDLGRFEREGMRDGPVGDATRISPAKARDPGERAVEAPLAIRRKPTLNVLHPLRPFRPVGRRAGS
jgi:hypothetical protein